jgi:hypothetical protein
MADIIRDIRDYQEDPEMGDENNPEYREEMFQMFRTLGWGPDDLIDRQYASQYAEWLKTVCPDEE